MSSNLTLEKAQENLKEVFRQLCIQRNASLNDLGEYNVDYDQRELALLHAFSAIGLTDEEADEIYEEVNTKTYTRAKGRLGQVIYTEV